MIRFAPFAFAIALSVASMGMTRADDAANRDSENARHRLSAAVTDLRPRQDAHRKADQAYEAAKKAYNAQAAVVAQKVRAEKEMTSEEEKAEKQVQKAGDKSGEDSREQIERLQAEFRIKHQGAEVDLTAAQNALDDLKRPENDAKREAAKQKALYDGAKSGVNSAARQYQAATCSSKNGFLDRALTKSEQEVKKSFAFGADPGEIDCAEIKDLLSPGLCQGEDINTLLPQIGIQAKNPSCEPASAETVGLSGNANAVAPYAR